MGGLVTLWHCDSMDSTAVDKAPKKRKVSSTKIAEDVESIKPPSELATDQNGLIIPEKKKSKYELFSTNPRYENASGDPVIEIPDIENCELWVFQFPKTFDLSSLNGVTMDLKKESNSSVGEFKDNDKSYYFYNTPSKEHFKLINIFPQTEGEDKKYCLGKPFARQINVLESITLPEGTTTMPKKESVPQVQNLLEQPFYPFGFDGEFENVSRVSIAKSRKKKKPRHSSLGIGANVKTPKKKRTKEKTPKKSKSKRKKSQ